MENDETNNLNRRINLNPNNNNLNNFTGGSNKIKIFVLINILILMTFCNYCYNQNPPIKENNLLPNLTPSILYYHEKNLIGPKNFPKKLLLRNMLEENNFNKTSEDENTLGSYSNYPLFSVLRDNNILMSKIQNYRILYYLKNNKFSCNWESISYNNTNEKYTENKNIFKVGKATKGKGQFIFQDGIEITNKIKTLKALRLVMINNEDEYIDNWIQLTIFKALTNITKYKNEINNTFILSGNFWTIMRPGKYFSLLEKGTKRCLSEINMTFPILYEIITKQIGNNTQKYKLASINVSNFNIIIDSNCGFKLNISAKTINKDIEKEILDNKTKLYFILTIISSILYCIGVFFVYKGIKNKEEYSTGINMESLCLNSVWNIYLCINNVSFSMTYPHKYSLFAIVACLCAVKLLVFDMRLLNIYWKALNSIYVNSNNNLCRFLKMKIRYFLLFYILFFLSFFMFNNLFINYFYIFCICFLLWTPKILYNAIYDIKLGFPFIYILGCTADRVVYPFYFRAVNNNFFMVRTNKFIISIILFYVIFSIVLLYIQLIKGSSYIFFQKKKEKKFDFYKSKNELLQINNNIGKEECLICLFNIFDDEEEIEIKENNNNQEIEMQIKEEKIDNDTENEKDGLIKNVQDDSIIKNSTTDNDIINDDACSYISDDSFMNLNVNEAIKNDELKNKKLSLFKFNTKAKNKSKKFVEENDVNINIKQKLQDETFKVKNNHFKNKIKNFIRWLFIENIKNWIKKVKFAFNLIFYYNFFSFYNLPLNIEGKLYMLTPCNHVFHSACLEEWLDHKKQCPNCREPLEKWL